MNSLSVPRIHYLFREFTIYFANSLSFSWIHYLCRELTIFFAKKRSFPRIHYLFHEFTFNPWSLSWPWSFVQDPWSLTSTDSGKMRGRERRLKFLPKNVLSRFKMAKRGWPWHFLGKIMALIFCYALENSFSHKVALGFAWIQNPPTL